MEGMGKEITGVIGVGYEGADIDSFVASLETWGVSVVVDVRLNPISRKKGFSKRALAAALEGADMTYLHLPALGNPKTNRDGFWNPDTPAWVSARAAYSGILDGDDAGEALRRIADLATEQYVAVLCFEASERCCHRHLVLGRVKEKLAAPAAA